MTFEEWPALGTWARVVVTENGDLPAARRAVDDVVGRVDRACSRFRSDSELTVLNQTAGRWSDVSPLLMETLEAARWAAAASGGTVDPTVGRALRAIGYDRDFAAVPVNGAPIEVILRPVPGWQALELDRARGRARLASGVEVDLGSTAKAWAADRGVAAAHDAAGSRGTLVSLGGDIAVAGDPPAGGWPILVAEDCTAATDPEGEVVLISDGGLATSSTRIRRWTKGEVAMHHIIDPATGAPATGPWQMATVAAATCLEANTAATAAIVLGSRAEAWLRERGLPARLVDQSGCVVTVGDWPAGRRVPA